ncbi:MAG: hypothetical protein ACOYLR_08395 [Chlorobium sp.]
MSLLYLDRKIAADVRLGLKSSGLMILINFIPLIVPLIALVIHGFVKCDRKREITAQSPLTYAFLS